MRRTFNSSEIEYLKEEFSKNPYPSKKQIELISKKLRKSDQKIRVINLKNITKNNI